MKKEAVKATQFNSVVGLLSLLFTSFSHPIDNGLVDSELIHECVTNKSVDLLLILDGSGSIGDDTFRNQIAFAMHLAQRLNVSNEGSRMAVIQFAETPRLEFTLNQYTHPTQLEWAIQRINFLSGATNTGLALKLALERGFEGARGGDIPRVAVVVTDGQSQDEVSEAAQLLRDAHIMLYAIGVTNLVNVHQLHQEDLGTRPKLANAAVTVLSCLQYCSFLSSKRPGTPDIICGPDKIGVRASTKKPFDGYVFVMDHFHEEECRAGPEMFPDSKSIGITVPFNACNVHRYRSLNPRGIFVEMTVVFMFHTLFMTKVDQMVKIQCFYMEADKRVTVPLSVSMITTQFREKMYQMPQCSYTLRKGGPDGEIVRYATLGESVYHRWECIEVEQKDTFGMLVHSCYVDNGHGDRVDILNEKGCGLDAVLLSTPDYDSSLRLATKPYHVFKYADRPVLQFQCQITLCLKYDGGCDGITPPKNCPSLPGEDGHHHHHGRKRKVFSP
ncbi:zona pellucida-like domain protein [Ancylostoma duodenale]|uniref:Zona pellucida-like domain protein n=1 Tax=Ancylostoma duodenale TaxID=51022 RepID=A0A0C2GRF1_9BILA|nr:zona pellucida-like domain protein [Ancylostoma duodenale]